MKGKKSSQNTDLAQKHSDNTQFLSFLHEDFLSKPSSKDAKSKLVIDTKELLTHACGQYKALLELPPLAFWSTMQHNAYVARALDSFLSFARRWHFSILDLTNPKDNAEYEEDLDYETIQIKKHLYVYFNELYRVILCVYDRLSSDPLDKSITHKIQYSEVIYQNWLFDIPKFLDICSIYYDCDGDRVKRILQNVFEIEDAYHDDFLDFIRDLTDNIIPNNLKIINRHRKREDLDTNTLNSDTEEKERVLIVLYDVVCHLKLICLCFPKKCVEGLYYDKKFLLLLENTYMVLNACSKAWRVNADRENILKSLVRRINNTIFRIFERVYNNIFGSILLTNKGDKISKDKKLWGTVNDFLNQTGKTMLKKKDEEPNHKFARKLMRYVDFGAILQKVPEGVLKEEDIQTNQVLLMVLRERTDMLKKKFGPVEEKEEVPVDHTSPEKAPVSATTTVQANAVPAVKLEKKTSVIDKEAESTKEAIRIIEISMGKKNKNLNIFDEDEVRGAMEATLKLAANTNVYDDEYDDTLEMYEEDRLRVGGDKADENEDDDGEDAKIEGAVKPEEGGKPGGQRARRGKLDKGGKNDGQKGGKTYEEKKGGYDNKDKQQGGQEERSGAEGYKYQSNRDDRGGYKGDRYQGDRYQGGDKYQQKGGNYQGERYQGDRYQGDKYQGGDRYQGDRYQGGDKYQQKGGNYQGGGYQGDRYQGNKYEENRGGYKGGYNRNDKLYQEKGKDSFEEERDEKRDSTYKGAEKSRDGGFAAEMQRGGGGGGFDQKKQNRNAYNDSKKYKGGNRNEKEFVPKK